MQQIKTTMNKSLADFTYKDSSMVQILKRTLEKLEFQGITVLYKEIANVLKGGSLTSTLITRLIWFLQGTIKFSDTGERTRPACIKQMQGKSFFRVRATHVTMLISEQTIASYS